ncbi:MAG: peptide chain release factor N(5)-glutamine methyltransferase [Bacteroidales bacterium]|jgi:release factor glutamine methyltransferase
MNIETNKISSVVKCFKEELKPFYPEEEIQNFIYLAFNFYFKFSRVDLMLKHDERISESEIIKLKKVLNDLKKYKPIQYILGKTEFYGLQFNVDENVLIPRPETEELVDLIIKENKNKNKNLKILDVGTGSGNIAVALKNNLPNAEVTAIDISDNILKIAEKNARINNVEINFQIADIFNEKEKSALSEFDIIVSNPPYICKSEKKHIENNVLDYEPHEALFVDDNNPLMFYEAISDFAKKHLYKYGLLYFEINERFGNAMTLMLKKKSFCEIMIRKDINNKDRFAKCETEN